MKVKILGVIFIVIIFIAGCDEKIAIKQNNVSMPETETQIVEAKADDNVLSNNTTNIDGTTLPETINKVVEVQSTPTPEIHSNKSKDGYTKLLEGKVICIDAGHGNPNHTVENEPIAPSSEILKPATAYGTTGISTKIPEYKLTMAVSLKIRDQLISQGATVVMTRESNDVDLGNIERSEIANKISSDIAVRIHADGFDNSSVAGISVLYPGSKYISDAELLRKSKVSAQLTLDELVKSTKGKSRDIVERDDLTGFNWSRVPVILVEMGFMTNPLEDERLNTEEYQNKIAEGIVSGLKRYFESL